VPRLFSQQGYTFNEILVAMMIGGIGVLGYAAVTATVIRGNQASANYTAAINLAQDKIEELRGQATLGIENRCPSSGDIALDALGNPRGIYERCWRITDSPHGAKLKQIEVIVSWRDLEPRSVALATLVFKE
jgi:hypothetical protein